MRFFLGLFTIFLFQSLEASIFIFNKNNQTKVERGSQEKRLSLLEEQLNEYLEESKKSPSASQNLCPWTVSGAIFLWQVKSGSSDWILKLSNQTLPYTGKISQPKFRWDIGGRIGLSRDFEALRAELLAEATFFSTKGKNKASVVTFFPSTADGGSEISTVNSNAKTSYEINLTSFVSSLNKRLFPSHHTFFDAKAGIFGAIIHQKRKTAGDNLVSAQSLLIPPTATLSSHLREKNNTSGIGPWAGMSANFMLCRGIGFFCDVNGSLFWNLFKVAHNQTFETEAGGFTPSSIYLNLKDSFHQLTPYSQVKIGLKYQKRLKDLTPIVFKVLEASLCYEVNYFWNINQFLKEVNRSSEGLSSTASLPIRMNVVNISDDLNFYGLTFNLSFGF
jgi:hypothetical protein